MPIGVLKSALCWLAFAGFMVQSLSAGLPGGPRAWALCLGCERTDAAWSICEPCVPGVSDGCDEDCGPGSAAGGSVEVGAAARAEGRCGCIDILLPGGPAPATARAVSTTSLLSDTFKATTAAPMLMVAQASPDPPWLACARAGPQWRNEALPRLLVPLSRKAVLII